MALNYAQELADYVRMFLDQDATTIPDSACENFVRAVEGNLNRGLGEHPRMRVKRSWRLQGGMNNIPVPEDMLQLIAVKRDGKRLEQFPIQREGQLYQCNGTGGFINFGNCLHIYPIPSETTDYALEMVVAVPSLLDAQQVKPNWVLTYHNDIYQKGMLAEAAAFLRDAQNAALWKQEFAASVEALRLQGWNEPIAGGPRVYAV